MLDAMRAPAGELPGRRRAGRSSRRDGIPEPAGAQPRPARAPTAAAARAAHRRRGARARWSAVQAQEPHAGYYGLWSRARGLRARGADAHDGGPRGGADVAHAGDDPSCDGARRARPAAGRAIGAGADLERAARPPAARRRGRRRRDRGGPRRAHRARPQRRGAQRLVAERWPERGATASPTPSASTSRSCICRHAGSGAASAAPPAALEAWLGEPVATARRDETILRYLAAFGPATAADVTWSGLDRRREAVDRLRPRLRTFQDERGRELLDVPAARCRTRNVRPGALPAVVRQRVPLPQGPLAHHPARIRAPEHRRHQPPGGAGGRLRARFWRIEDSRLHVEPIEPLSRRDGGAVQEEGERLLAFAAR